MRRIVELHRIVDCTELWVIFRKDISENRNRILSRIISGFYRQIDEMEGFDGQIGGKIEG